MNGTVRAKHHFSRRCGTCVFHCKRAASDHFGVNIFCLDGFDVASLPVRATEGIGMTLVCDNPRAEWPGPRMTERARGALDWLECQLYCAGRQRRRSAKRQIPVNRFCQQRSQKQTMRSAADASPQLGLDSLGARARIDGWAP